MMPAGHLASVGALPGDTQLIGGPYRMRVAPSTRVIARNNIALGEECALRLFRGNDNRVFEVYSFRGDRAREVYERTSGAT